MLPFGPITNAERAVWQARAAALLADYLDAARRRDLPPIEWSVTTAGSALIGHCHSAGDWDRWQEFLKLPQIRPETVHAGYARRRASGAATTRGGMSTHVTLIADIDLQHEQLDRDRHDQPPRDVG